MLSISADIREENDLEREDFVIDKESCCGCGACDNACPADSISMQKDSEGFYFPVIDKEKCIHCGKCRSVCPVLKARQQKKGGSGRSAAYAIAAKNEKLRNLSSSGGVFSILAGYVLSKHGAVFGAALTEDCRKVCHIEVENAEELRKLRGSKYVQSSTGKCYRRIRQHLSDGKMVFFTGTPCQVEGLYAYLGRDDENLITADLICHGVPSPNVWEKYVEYQEDRACSSVREVFFRKKSHGWKACTMSLLFSSQKKYEQDGENDLYFQAFIRNACLRKSCHQCMFKTTGRASDFTMADFWGIEYVFPDWNDDKGVSLLLIHSDKGKEVFEKVRHACRVQETCMETAVSYNPAAVSSYPPHSERSEFLRHVNDMPFDRAFRKYSALPFSVRREAGKILRKAGIHLSIRSSK